VKRCSCNAHKSNRKAVSDGTADSKALLDPQRNVVTEKYETHLWFFHMSPLWLLVVHESKLEGDLALASAFELSHIQELHESANMA
jgi:hypothetical protein